MSQAAHEETEAGLRPEFPEIAWTGLFGRYREIMAPTTEAPTSFLWGTVAAILSFLVGRGVSLEWGPGRLVPALLTCLVGPTAKVRKSTVIEDALETMARPLLAELNGVWKHPGAIVVGTGSGEGFAEALTVPEGTEGDQGKRGLFVIHELGALLEKVGRDQAGNMLEFMLASYDARPDWVHRTRTSNGSAPLKLTNAAAVFLCASTEAWLVRSLRETQVRAGLMNRFLWLTGSRGQPIPRRPPVREAALRSFQADLRGCVEAVNGSPCTFEPEADELWAERYCREYHRGAETDLAAAAVARADGLALRLAMLLAAADATTRIRASHVAAAWAVADHSSAVAEGIVSRMLERNMRDAEDRVLAAVRRHMTAQGPSFTKNQIWQRLKGQTGMPRETFCRAFKALQESGELTGLSLGAKITSGGNQP
ncbi:MAG: DUF3987 domain-containing protein [Pseudomonadota bacterium]